MTKSGKEADMKNVHLPPDSSDSIFGIEWMQAGLCLSLCALIAVLGFWFYFALRDEEISKFKSQYTFAAASIMKSVTEGFERKVSAASLINHMYSNANANGCGGILPNFTLPGYEETMHEISRMSGLRTISFSPLVTANTRHSWETYATENVYRLNGPSFLNKSTNKSWVVADGIFTVVNHTQVKSDGNIKHSLYPTYLFPIWQIYPIAILAKLIMLDPHGLDPTRTKTIDTMIASKEVVFSEIVQLVSDVDGFRPSTLIFGPIQTLDNNQSVIGYVAGGFSWDDVLRGTLSNNYNIVCVISTSKGTYCLNCMQVPFTSFIYLFIYELRR